MTVEAGVLSSGFSIAAYWRNEMKLLHLEMDARKRARVLDGLVHASVEHDLHFDIRENNRFRFEIEDAFKARGQSQRLTITESPTHIDNPFARQDLRLRA